MTITETTTTTTEKLAAVPGIGTAEVTVSQRGEGRPILVLHGGGGPATVTGWAGQLAEAQPARVITPVHPGFNGTPRADGLASIRGLAQLYVSLLEQLDLTGVTVVGNSIGGWIAAEMAVLGSDRVTSYVLVDAVGIDDPEHPVTDFFALTPAEIAEHSYFDPETFGIDPSKLPPEALQAMAGNRATLVKYAGTAMSDSTLLGRLTTVDAPVLVLWGEADRIADPGFGATFAAAIPGARFAVLPRAGHLPQIETPEQLTEAVWSFIS